MACFARNEEKFRQHYAEITSGMGADTGYLLTFDFRREQNKEHRAKWVAYKGKRIFDVIV